MDAKAAFRSLKEAAAEVVTEEELKALCERAEKARSARGSGGPEPLGAQGAATAPRAYIGFEPSGTAHVGWMVCADTVRRLAAAGFDTTILLADWHAQINDKLGGDLAAIQRCGKYMEEVFEALGIAPGSVTYRYANEFASNSDYWARVMKVAQNTSMARMRRALEIMGRKEEEADRDTSKFLYPAMQVADIFHMGIDLAYGGLDQRHAHMLARELADKLHWKKPVALHTPLVPSLKQGEGRMDAPGKLKRQVIAGMGSMAMGEGAMAEDVSVKMSKSDPSSGIFLHDSSQEVKAKLKAAHCPAKEVEGNPVIDLLRLVVWPRLAELHKDGPPRFEIHRPEKFGGNKLYIGYEALVAEYRQGALHPLDLKNGVADALNILLAPVAAYFKARPQNLQFVQSLRATR